MDRNATDEPGASPTPPDFSRVTWDWFAVVQLSLAVAGVLGNALVIAVYFRRLRGVRSNSNRLIALLALADLLTSLAALPLPSLAAVPRTPAGRAYCRLVHSRLVMWVSIVASVLTLTLLSLERYFAVVHPVRHKAVFSRRHLRYFVAVVWLAALLLNSGSLYVPDVSEGHYCYLAWPSPAFQAGYGLMLFLLEFLMPVAVMAVSHYFAVRGLKRQAAALLRRNKSAASPAFSLLESRRQVIRIILVVVITFVVCWGPDQLGFLVFNLGGLSPAYFSSLTYRAFTVLAFLNSCVNPLIYVGLNKNFRAAVLQLLPSSASRARVGPAATDDEATGTGTATGGTATATLPLGGSAGLCTTSQAVAASTSGGTMIIGAADAGPCKAALSGRLCTESRT